MQTRLWFEINKREFEELTRSIYKNQDNNDFQIIISKITYDLKNTKKFWVVVTTRKTTESKAKKMCNKLIQKNMDALWREKSNRSKKYNILNILNNVGSIFTAAYLHYKDVPKEKIFERNIKEKIIPIRGRLDEIKK